MKLSAVVTRKRTPIECLLDWSSSYSWQSALMLKLQAIFQTQNQIHRWFFSAFHAGNILEITIRLGKAVNFRLLWAIY